MRGRGLTGSTVGGSVRGSRAWPMNVLAAVVLGLVALVSACSSTRPCRQGSILVTVDLSAAPMTARTLEVDVTLDNAAQSPLMWTANGTAFAKSESLEIDPSPYKEGVTVAITVVARTEAGDEVARGFVQSTTSPGCLPTKVTLNAPASNGGAGGTAATGGAGGQSSTGGARAGGSGGEVGASGGGTGNAGGAIGTAGVTGTGGSAGLGGNASTGGRPGSGGSVGQGGSAGTRGSGGAGGGGGDPCVTSGAGAVAVLGCPCTAPGTLACNGNAQAVTLICSGGTWTHNETCMAGNLCDSRTGVSRGTCQPIIAACQSAAPGQIVCDTATSVGQCGADLVTLATMQGCTGTTPACLSGACVACKPTTTEACGTCNDGTETCDGAGAWGACVGASSKNTYYRDADSDGFGNPAMSMTVCGAAPTGWVSNSKDCCDADANAHPGQTAFFTTADMCGSSQVPDGFDYDCDGTDTTQASALNASCVSTLMTGNCGCPMCYCNSMNGGAAVCGKVACPKYEVTACGVSYTESTVGFDSMTCAAGGGGGIVGLQGCR